MQWAGIISIIALVVAMLAVPTFLQMLYGKPGITLSFEEDIAKDNERFLRCKLYNYPIEPKSLLGRIGVRRYSASDVVCYLSITEFGTSKVYLPEKNIKIRTGQYYEYRVPFPSSALPNYIGIVVRQQDGKIMPWLDNTTIELGVGKYGRYSSRL